jgi:hypothetical protein
MGRVILGLLKGGVVGAALGALAFKLGVGGGVLGGVFYALIGGAAGLLCGRPPWRQDTFWTSALKGLFGIGVGVGLYLLARKFLGGAHASFTASLGAPDRPLVDIPLLLGPAIGALWGMFVEVDDSAGPENRAGNKGAGKAPGKG